MPGLPDGGGAALPEEPPAAVLSDVFGDRVTLARTYAAHLATTGVTRGLLGPREVPRLWGRHLLNCAVVAPLLPPAARVVDVGSGAGLPGIVLALIRPDAQVTLVEPLLRRATWLAEVVGELALGNVQVVRARADEVERGEADVVTARAVAPLEKLSAWCLPLLRPGGTLLAIKGRSAHEELLAAEPGLRAAGAERWGVHVLESAYLDEPTTVVEVRTAARRPSSGAPARGRARGRD